MQTPQKITVMPVKVKTELADLETCADIYVQAEYIVTNEWWWKEGDSPDVQIVCYRLSYNGKNGHGDVEAPIGFFGANCQRVWEAQIAQQLEAEYER